MTFIQKVRNYPTTLTAERVEREKGGAGWHESCLRAYHVLGQVKWLLKEGTPGVVVLELIEEMERD